MDQMLAAASADTTLSPRMSPAIRSQRLATFTQASARQPSDVERVNYPSTHVPLTYDSPLSLLTSMSCRQSADLRAYSPPTSVRSGSIGGSLGGSPGRGGTVFGHMRAGRRGSTAASQDPAEVQAHTHLQYFLYTYVSTHALALTLTYTPHLPGAGAGGWSRSGRHGDAAAGHCGH
jgi:hypothetical protein